MRKCVYLGVSSEPWRPTFERMGIRSSLGEVLYRRINLLPMACLFSLMLNSSPAWEEGTSEEYGVKYMDKRPILVYIVETTGVSVERPNYHPAAPMGGVNRLSPRINQSEVGGDVVHTFY